MRLVIIVVGLLVLGSTEVRAERASVAAGKAVVTAAKAVGAASVAAVSTCPGRSAWRGLRWLGAHL